MQSIVLTGATVGLAVLTWRVGWLMLGPFVYAAWMLFQAFRGRAPCPFEDDDLSG